MGNLLKKMALHGARAIGQAAVTGAAHALRKGMEKRSASEETIQALEKVEGAMSTIAPDMAEEAVGKALNIEVRREKVVEHVDCECEQDW